MSTTATFSAPLIGQTEHALAAILGRQLAGTGLNRGQWITLTLATAGGGRAEHDQLIGRVATALKVGESEARAYITELVAAQLLLVSDDEGAAVTVTHAGRRLHSRISDGVAEITRRLWDDLPGEDLAAAAHVLSTVLARANQELSTPRSRSDSPLDRRNEPSD